MSSVVDGWEWPSRPATVATSVPLAIRRLALLSVSINLNVYVDASGKLVVTAALGNSAKVEYQKGAGLRQSASSTARADLDAAIQVDFGAQLSAYLKLLGIKVVNANVKVGGQMLASAYVGGTCEASEENDTMTLNYKESMNANQGLRMVRSAK